MELNRTARKFYTLELAATDVTGAALVDPPDYEASFDEGETWVVGTQMSGNGWWQWLVAGPNHDVAADPLPGGFTLAATITNVETQPWIRVVDTPELDVIDDAPPIYLTPRI